MSAEEEAKIAPEEAAPSIEPRAERIIYPPGSDGTHAPPRHLCTFALPRHLYLTHLCTFAARGVRRSCLTLQRYDRRTVPQVPSQWH